MSLTQLLSDVQSLSRVDKLHLIQFVARDLAEAEVSALIPPQQAYPIWSPDQAFSAAEAMLQALQAEKDNP